MAITHCTRLCILIYKKGEKNILSAVRNNFQYLLSVVNYSNQPDTSNKGMSRAIKAHLEKAIKYDQFLKEQIREYEKGKEFLASMMGKKNKTLTQEEVDEAIEYLFPSKLYVPKSRPLMKPPLEVFSVPKQAEFDYSGRPFHFLFYTTKKNFYQILHDAAKVLDTLNLKAVKNKHPPESLQMAGNKWLTHKELEDYCKEILSPSDYEKFLEVVKKIIEHPFSSDAKSFVKKFWVTSKKSKEESIPKSEITDDKTHVATIERACRKTSVAKVSLSCPGTGKIRINNMGIDYFSEISSREQVIFPLLCSNMLNKVDVEATVTGGGYSSQAGAVRLGIALALQAFVSPEIQLQMKLSGLLQRDFRTRERKKPGKEGARRAYTWLKR